MTTGLRPAAACDLDAEVSGCLNERVEQPAGHRVRDCLGHQQRIDATGERRWGQGHGDHVGALREK